MTIREDESVAFLILRDLTELSSSLPDCSRRFDECGRLLLSFFFDCEILDHDLENYPRRISHGSSRRNASERASERRR